MVEAALGQLEGVYLIVILELKIKLTLQLERKAHVSLKFYIFPHLLFLYYLLFLSSKLLDTNWKRKYLE